MVHVHVGILLVHNNANYYNNIKYTLCNSQDDITLCLFQTMMQRMFSDVDDSELSPGD